MIVIVTGASHTGKTLLAQRLMEELHIPVLSMDLLKMGLIRSGRTELTPLSPHEDMTAFLWPILREIIKTALENEQDLIVEGCYVPGGWERDFSEEERKKIRFLCLVMSRTYIETHFHDIRGYASVIEKRLDDSDFTREEAICENAYYQRMCEEYHYPMCLMEDEYSLPV